MKVFAFMLFVAILLVVDQTTSSPEEFNEKISNWVHECGTELDIPKEKMEEWKSMTKPTSDRLATCFVACVMKKGEVLKDGKLQDSVMDTYLTSETSEDKEKVEWMKGVTKECIEKASGETDECTIADVFTVCISDKVKSMKSEDWAKLENN